MDANGYDYDLLVIGSGPAGQRAAVQAAKAGKRVAVVERHSAVGGVCINTGTIPSKTLREAVLYLSGYHQRALYGESYAVKDQITIEDLLFRADHVIRHEVDVTRAQLTRNGIDLISASVSFADPHTVLLTSSSAEWLATAAVLVIATGSESTKDEHIPFDSEHVLTSDDVLAIKQLPQSLAVVGAGVIGCEYASMFAALGRSVTLIDARSRLLPSIDAEIVDELVHQLRAKRVVLRLNESVAAVTIDDAGPGALVRVHLESGKQVAVDRVLYCIGRTGATQGLRLEAAGLAADPRGRLRVNERYQTDVPHIYAAGDVIGFPSLAATSMEQGRLAACHAFGIESAAMSGALPYAIYTIPEISTVGQSEEELTRAAVPYEAGRARYSEMARGQIVGDEGGMLKILVHANTRQLLGVHIVGTGASELVHIGQAVMALGGGVDYLINAVFNYPTLAECYKTAALDAVNRLRSGQARAA